MKKAIVFVMAVVLLFSARASAEERADKEKDARYADIKELLVVTGSAGIGKQILAEIMGMFKNQEPDIKPEFWDKVMKNIKTEEVDEKVLPIYDKYLTNADVKAVISFYKSDVGKKLMTTMPKVMSEAMTIGQEWGDGKVGEIMKELEKEKGVKQEKKEEKGK